LSCKDNGSLQVAEIFARLSKNLPKIKEILLKMFPEFKESYYLCKKERL
jgi:hypothetical protein